MRYRMRHSIAQGRSRLPRLPRLNRRWQTLIESCVFPRSSSPPRSCSGSPTSGSRSARRRRDADAVRGGLAASGPRGEVPVPPPHAPPDPPARVRPPGLPVGPFYWTVAFIALHGYWALGGRVGFGDQVDPLPDTASSVGD